jgi:hypothetical protein
MASFSSIDITQETVLMSLPKCDKQLIAEWDEPDDANCDKQFIDESDEPDGVIRYKKPTDEDWDEIEHVGKMKDIYGPEQWMWFVEGTEDDCSLAERHRQFLFKQGFHPDFNIYDDEQRKYYYGNYEGEEEEEEDAYDEVFARYQEERALNEKKRNEKTLYVQKMEGLYGKQWFWCVIKTEHDCDIAKEYRDLDCDEMNRYPEDFEDMENDIMRLPYRDDEY